MNFGKLLLTLILVVATYPVHISADEHEHGGHGQNGGEKGHEEEHEGHGEHHDEHGTELSEDVLSASGVTLEHAGPVKIAITLRLNGQVVPIEEKTAHIIPRFSGIVKEVRKNLGNQVTEGETVAVVESNQSLQHYEIKSLIAGTITKQHITRGEFVSDATEIFEVIDISEVYANFFAFAPDYSKIKLGQRVILTYQGTALSAVATISFISPLIDDATQSKFVRVRIKNPEGLLSPGAFLTGDVVLEEATVPLGVRADAIQTHEGKQVVFVRENKRLEPRPITAGHSDGFMTEVISGLSAGDEYAAGNTFILKAEAGKGAAEHEH